MRTEDFDELTPQEEALLRLLSLGCTVKQAAAVLNKSWHTVDNQKSRVMQKLEVNNLATLTRRALELGVSTLDDTLSTSEARKASNHAPPNQRKRRKTRRR